MDERRRAVEDPLRLRLSVHGIQFERLLEERYLVVDASTFERNRSLRQGVITPGPFCVRGKYKHLICCFLFCLCACECWLLLLFLVKRVFPALLFPASFRWVFGIVTSCERRGKCARTRILRTRFIQWDGAI